MTTPGERIIKSARQALAFADGKQDHGCVVHIPDEIDVRRIRKKASLSQAEFADYCPHLGGLKPPPLGGSFSTGFDSKA